MSEFVVDPGAVTAAATSIADTGERIAALELTSPFSQLEGAFVGASDPMRQPASQGDQQVKSALANAAGHIKGWSELIMGFKGAVEEMDAYNATRIRTIMPPIGESAP
ncbi:hypothetical protein VZC37_15650 [Gordonia sp. LSe1-13]|uniref:PE domain-containing protein n=1 Tax=Gordonia sesuvii TaxID=3116777 RepID=A0ABU7MF98_9ACTN|nr:hypothetical protein [Gordonia sp. LSe1-13]